jgi:hypothetical protein
MRIAIAASASDAMQQILTRGDTGNISDYSVEYEVREMHTTQIIGPRALSGSPFNQQCARHYALEKK